MEHNHMEDFSYINIVNFALIIKEKLNPCMHEYALIYSMWLQFKHDNTT